MCIYLSPAAFEHRHRSWDSYKNIKWFHLNVQNATHNINRGFLKKKLFLLQPLLPVIIAYINKHCICFLALSVSFLFMFVFWELSIYVHFGEHFKPNNIQSGPSLAPCFLCNIISDTWWHELPASASCPHVVHLYSRMAPSLLCLPPLGLPTYCPHNHCIVWSTLCPRGLPVVQNEGSLPSHELPTLVKKS